MNDVAIRQMREADIEAAMRLKNAEGWNQTELDWYLFINHDPELCLVACFEDEVIGTVTGINYDNEVAWIGMMLVSRDFRGRGVGKMLLEAIIERLDGCHSIKLDATPAGQPVYQKLGFVEEFGLHRLIVEELSSASEELLSGEIRLIEDGDIPEIVRLDKQAFGSDRTRLIQNLVKNLPGQSWMCVREDRTTGFILGRQGTRFNHLGPIVAESIEDAKSLISKVAKDLAAKPVVMDIPVSKVEWQNWLIEMGFTSHRSLSRMYFKNNQYAKQGDFQYAICGPELG
jgi:predicted N-acetyltransferase YhbS